MRSSLTVIDSPSVPTKPKSALKDVARVAMKVFVGPDGVRAGWRLAIFLGMVVLLIASAAFLTRAFHQAAPPPTILEPRYMLWNESVAFGLVLFASWVMSRMEHRKVSDYGLPLRRACATECWQGLAIGFGSISALLVVMRLVGVFHFGTIGLHGFEFFKFAALWSLAFLAVGLFEEFFFRGYALFTLTTGITFWPSAVLLSALFGLLHHSNPGESWAGALTAGALGLLCCLILRRTGSLWMAIGFHAAWDWGQTFFYGVPDSGYPSVGHLFNPTFAGPAWLTGGSAGPEGSWLCVALYAMLCIGFFIWLREKKEPEPQHPTLVMERT